MYQDDLVDYNDALISIVPDGITPDYVSIYDFTDYLTKNVGKVVSNVSINKDKGVIIFNDSAEVNVPLGRLFASYFYHTYLRLTNDGYGDLNFYDQTLVPDSGLAMFKDWTYVDLKLINEGSNTLMNGALKFISRGYVSQGSTVDRVLDNNRPWDVQKGTVAETVSCTGGTYSGSYTALPDKTRAVATSYRNSGQTINFGSLLAKGHVYVRIYWCLWNGGAYVDTTRGDKLYSAELSGRYYVLTSGS